MAKRTQDTMEYQDDEFELSGQSESSDDYKVSADDFSELFIVPSDWSISVVRQYIKDRISLDPEFQRRGVWNKVAKSKFIESLFLGIPIPQILLAQKSASKGKYLVLDGKQRLLTIKEFFDGFFDDGSKFVLKGLETLTELNDLAWDEISGVSKHAHAIENATIRTATVRGWKTENVLYEIFYRLNSGSVKLSPMELRMALVRGPFLRHVIKWSETLSELHGLLRLKNPDKRMTDVELTVRYLAFRSGDIEYRGNLKQFLDDFCKLRNENYDAESLDRELKKFTNAIAAAREIFGDKAVCRKWLPDEGRFDTRFNRAIFDVVIGSLSNVKFRQWAVENENDVVEAFQQVSEDDTRFISAVESTTKSIDATRDRFEIWYNKVHDLSDVRIKLPNIADKDVD